MLKLARRIRSTFDGPSASSSFESKRSAARFSMFDGLLFPFGAAPLDWTDEFADEGCNLSSEVDCCSLFNARALLDLGATSVDGFRASEPFDSFRASEPFDGFSALLVTDDRRSGNASLELLIGAASLEPATGACPADDGCATDLRAGRAAPMPVANSEPRSTFATGGIWSTVGLSVEDEAGDRDRTGEKACGNSIRMRRFASGNPDIGRSPSKPRG
jgi:hypothetical protein